MVGDVDPDDAEDAAALAREVEGLVRTDNGPRPEDGPQPEDNEPPELEDEED
jgi:hypothetical protein